MSELRHCDIARLADADLVRLDAKAEANDWSREVITAEIERRGLLPHLSSVGDDEGMTTLPPPNLMTRRQLLDAYYEDRETIATLHTTLLSVLAHLEGRSDMSTDGRWEPLMIDLIRKRVGWPPRDE